MGVSLLNTFLRPDCFNSWNWYLLIWFLSLSCRKWIILILLHDWQRDVIGITGGLSADDARLAHILHSLLPQFSECFLPLFFCFTFSPQIQDIISDFEIANHISLHAGLRWLLAGRIFIWFGFEEIRTDIPALFLYLCQLGLSVVVIWRQFAREIPEFEFVVCKRGFLPGRLTYLDRWWGLRELMSRIRSLFFRRQIGHLDIHCGTTILIIFRWFHIILNW